MARVGNLRHMPHGEFRRRLAAVALMVALVGAPLVSSANAHGDPIGDLQQRANEVAAQISQLQAQIEADSNDWEAARYRVAQLQDQIKDSEAKVAQAKQDESAKRKQLSAYAVNAYVSGGEGPALTDMLNSQADKLEQRQGYARSAVGDRQELIDQLQASQQIAKDQITKLHDDQAAAEAEQAQADAKRQSAQDAANRLETVRSQVQGDLAELVRKKQEAEARAAQERAYQQAQADARAQAAQAQAAQAQAQAQAQARTRSVPAPSNTYSPSSAPSSESAPAVNIPSNGSVASIAIAAAQSQLGVPYVWGGASPGGGFDCSGLIMWAYGRAGVSLPHYTGAQEQVGRVVPLSQIQPGDLVFYWNGGHVALYIGGGSVIHAPHTGDVVRYGSLYMDSPELVVRPYA